VRFPVWVLLVAVPSVGSGIVGLGCSPAGRTTAPIAATGARTEDLSGGRLDALPSGPLFIRVQHFAQAPETEFGSRSHQPGFEYQVDGTQLLEIQGGPTISIRPGESYFQPSIGHTHRNPGPGTNSWYFLALWPSSARQAPQVTPSAKVVYETEDLSPAGLPAGPYVETLQLVTVAPGGHTTVHERSGMQILFIFSGSIRLQTAHGSSVLGAGDGAYMPLDSREEEVNAGGGEARYLDFTATPTGRPFEVTVARL
jgi:quercetin dioxygenase-like cupin family protein